MSNLSRRGVLSLGAALGLAGATNASPAWSWSPRGSVAGTGAAVDPQWIWDDEIDRIMAAVTDNGQVAAVNTAIRPWVDNGDPVPAGLPADLTAFLERSVRLPAWADRDKLRRAGEFNRRMSNYLFFLYGLGGGIMSTVIPREARSVYWSKGGADMQDRAAKTFTFGYDLSDRNAFEPDGQFLVTANKTRMVHATVRHILPRSPYWKAVADERIPISNGDILVTFHSTGTYAYSKLKEWRIRMTAAEEDAFLHSWQVALSQLGVRDEYIPASWAAARAQANQVLWPVLTPTDEGKDLAGVLLGLVAQVDGGLTRGFLNEFTRYLLNDDIGDWLGLPRDRVSEVLVKNGWPAYLAFREGLSPILPTPFHVFDELLEGVAMAFLNNGTSTTTTPIEIPDMNRPGV
jgi:hypothetical protein